MTKTIELSKRLNECADCHDSTAILFENRSQPGAAEVHRQWAEDIRSLIIPPPGERDETHNNI